jgi:hypothetical protein
VINPIRRTDSFNIKINLALFIFYFIFLVDWILFLKNKN